MKVAEKYHYHDLLVKYSNDMKKILGCHKKYYEQNSHIQGRFKIGET